MIRFALDSDDLSALDQPVDIILTYADLVKDASGLRFPLNGRAFARIDRGLGDHGVPAPIWDVESGALRPADLPGKYDAAAKAGVEMLTAYANRATMPAVDAVMGNRVFHRWFATLDGSAHVAGYTPMRGPAAIQCLSEAMLGIHADGSLVFLPDWFPTPALERAHANLVSAVKLLDAVSATVKTIEQQATWASQRVNELR
jgi:hypothetical protein